MDTKEDFVFLDARVADNYNPYQEGEYLVVQTRSGWRLQHEHRGFDYRAARRFCDMENMGSDYNHYSVRIIHQGKLHHVNWDGAATKPSKEQDWKIHEDYYNARYVEDLDCEIEVCDCSYPIFWNYKSITTLTGEAVTDWLSTTCLINDHGRDISCCPNCGTQFFEQEEEEDEEDKDEEYSHVPETCKGCRYYSDDFHLACAVHPYGPVEDICPDYSM